MPTIFGICDTNVERRRDLLAKVSGKPAKLQGLQTVRQHWHQGDLEILCCGSASLPLCQTNSNGAWIGLCGRPIADFTPQCFAERIIADPLPAINAHSGLYLGCYRNASGQIILGTDALGFFPLYYWANAELLVFSSSPTLVKLHPEYSGGISPEGLAGIMLLGFMAGGQSIWSDIRRPEPGSVISWRPGKGAEIVPANALLPDEAHFDLSLGAARKLAVDTFRDAVLRSVNSVEGPVNFMLSGGLDSRLVAACLAETAPGRANALIFGQPDDIEVRCAEKVAGTLNFPHTLIPEFFESYVESAKECIVQEGLSNSLWDFAWQSVRESIPAQPILSGLHGDRVMGGLPVDYNFDKQRGVYDFDYIFKRFNASGLKPGEIVDLVDMPEMKTAVNRVIDKLRAQYEALPGLPFQKAILWELYYRNRFHVNPYAFRLADSGWPLIPYIDRNILQLALGLPMNYLSGRRLQTDILKYAYPALARLPLDRNSYDLTPLLPTWHWKIEAKWNALIGRLKPAREETRTYYRQFDVNNSGWVQIREAAEIFRPKTRDLLRADALDAWLPAPEVKIAASPGIMHAAKPKLLAMLLLFLKSCKEDT